MRPFSATYYIKENKNRCILLVLMIILSFGVYLGGLYVTNPMDNWTVPIDYYKNMVTVSTGTPDSEDYQWFVDKAKADGKVTVIEMGEYNGLKWNSVMGFESGTCSFSFQTVDDFRTYCEYVGIQCDFDALKPGSMILSEQFAKNRGLELGDVVDKNFEWDISGEYTLDATINEEAYISYYITGEINGSQGILMLGKTISGNEIYDYAHELQNQLDNPDNVYVYEGFESDLEGEFEFFYLIYIFIVLLMSVIFAVTVNAAFVGMYQKREHEFAVYRAIGMSKRSIIGKIVRELLLMDVIAICIGTAVLMLGLYLLNNLVLYPDGKYLRYYDSLALINMISCNIMILLPLIWSRCRRMLKADICNY